MLISYTKEVLKECIVHNFARHATFSSFQKCSLTMQLNEPSRWACMANSQYRTRLRPPTSHGDQFGGKGLGGVQAFLRKVLLTTRTITYSETLKHISALLRVEIKLHISMLNHRDQNKNLFFFTHHFFEP